MRAVVYDRYGPPDVLRQITTEVRTFMEEEIGSV